MASANSWGVRGAGRPHQALLSTAQLIRTGAGDADPGWRMILVGAMSNLAFKGLTVAVLAHRSLTAHVAVLFGASLAGGGLILWLWPATPVP